MFWPQPGRFRQSLYADVNLATMRAKLLSRVQELEKWTAPFVKRTTHITLVSGDGKLREDYLLTDKGLVAVSPCGHETRGRSLDAKLG